MDDKEEYNYNDYNNRKYDIFIVVTIVLVSLMMSAMVVITGIIAESLP